MNNEELDQEQTPFEIIGDFFIAGLIAVGALTCIGLAVLVLLDVIT